MPGIERPPIRADVETVAALLDQFLGAVMTRLARRLQLAEPELLDVAVVRLNVVTDGRRLDDATLEAKFAQRIS